MFNVTKASIVPWHTGDYNLDQIYPNTNVCPALDVVEANFYASDAYIAERTTAEQVSDLIYTIIYFSCYLFETFFYSLSTINLPDTKKQLPPSYLPFSTLLFALLIHSSPSFLLPSHHHLKGDPEQAVGRYLGRWPVDMEQRYGLRHDNVLHRCRDA